MRAYVLAGGRGTRLSPDKGFLTVGGRTLLERVCVAAAPLVTETVLVGSPVRLRPAGLRALEEEASGTAGPLAALCTALADAGGEDVLLLPCDTPFLETRVLRYLQEAKGEADAAVPRRGEEAEPLVAIYGPRCLAPARQALASGARRVIAFYGEVSVRWVSEEELRPFGDWETTFFNVNTPEELERAERLAAMAGGTT
jgi:molybdopterin-guanine dinucleotide biosynthesis protein A